MTTPPLIGLIGHKRVGKDTFAQRLIDHHGYVKVAFADPLRELVARIDGIVTFEQLGTEGSPEPVHVTEALFDLGYEGAKDALPEYRRLLQATGNGVRDVLGEYIWVDAAMARVHRLRGRDDGLTLRAVADAKPVVVADVRRLNEANAIKAAGGITVRVVRDTGLPEDTDISETELDDYEADYRIDNNVPIEVLYECVDAFATLASNITGGIHPTPLF